MKRTYSPAAERPALVWLKDFVRNSVDQPYCDLVTGVENGETELKVYPNPVVDGTIRIEHPRGIGTVKIIDTLGRVLALADGRGETSLMLTLDVAPGLYIVNITDSGETLERRLWIP